jgi:hypothetical protein
MYVYSYKHIHAAPESIDDPRRYPEDLIYPDVVRCHMSKNALRTEARQAGKVNSKGQELARARQIRGADFSTPR